MDTFCDAVLPQFMLSSVHTLACIHPRFQEEEELLLQEPPHLPNQMHLTEDLKKAFT